MQTALKALVLAGYAVSIVAWIMPSLPATEALRWVGPGLIAAHVGELAFYIPWFRKHGRDIAPELPGLLTFGLFHFFSIKDR